MADVTLSARPAFHGLMMPVGEVSAPGVRVSERTDLSLATVIARRGRGAAAREAAATRYGLTPPDRAMWAAADGLTFVSTGPDAWFAVREGGGYELAGELRSALGEAASVSDQTDGYAVLWLSGPRIRDVFAKGIHLDLHPDVFPVGAAAVTDAAHIGVILWRLADRAADEPVFEVAIFRSYAGSFWRWLSSSAAEFGLAVDA
ncbi:sarcosine oxidase subunit gamma [Lutibaculum baratangense]|uniref:Sarcosine oxidase, gamma subunit n=1 Tax=Lutibaculum baratangense AMV1 TaxID=631454 RepID=V4RMR5_9HYPH|nr:sarcosine oxidase subunit gamma family protein [Lutibaculum baratangense]ESR24495.1 Sarcosine oxidase, gamma subunit [Lutibaculum baratangense AMV1]